MADSALTQAMLGAIGPQPGEDLAAGIDIGGTTISVLVCERDGRVLAEVSARAPAQEGGDRMIEVAVSLVRKLESIVGRHISTAGVGAAGVIDPVSGTIAAASDTFAGWIGYPVKDALERLLGVPVSVDNDVNAFLAGELAYGAARGTAHAVGIMLGTGVGGAIALDGAVYPGHRGAAGEIGHTPGYGTAMCTCGQVGHLETVASGSGIARRFTEVTGVAATGSDVAGFARAGDMSAQRVFVEAGEALAKAIATAVNLLDVDRAVIGGGVRSAWDLFSPALESGLADNAPVSGYPLDVVPSALGSRAGALGAAATAFGLIPHVSVS